MAPSGDNDPLADANFQALVEALAREGLPRRPEAARAVEAVMCALAQRIQDPDYEGLHEHLPEPFRGRLGPCERHAAVPPHRVVTADDFYRVVAEDLDRAPDDVEPIVRAVFGAVRGQLPESEAELVENELPLELVPLWRRLS